VSDLAPGPSASGPSLRHSLLMAGGLLLGVAVLLVGGLVAGRHFRSTVGTQPAPSIAAPASPATPATVAAPAVAASPAVSAPASAVPSLPVSTDPLALEIEQAYLHYWDVRSQAFFNLDPTHLPEVMAGAELSRELQQMKDMQAQGRAGKVDVEHHILLGKVTPTSAVVYDEYLNRSVFVDASTKQVIPTSSPPITEKVSYEMQKIDGTWKVVDGAQHD
jgi:hypothetical protein